MQRVAARVDDRRELAIFDASTHGGGVCLVVDFNLIEMNKGDLILIAVGDGVERVPGTECTKLRASLRDVLDLDDRGWGKNVIRAVGDVAGPVFTWRGLLLAGGKLRQHRACHDRS